MHVANRQRKKANKHMKLGISSYTYGWAVSNNTCSVFDLLEYAKEFGLNLVQIGDNLPLHELPPETLQQLSLLSAQKGIEIEVGTRGFKLDNILRYIDISKRLNSSLLRIIIDDVNYQPEKDQVLSIYKKVEHQLKENRMKLAVENHDRFSSSTLKQLMIEANSPWLGICLDTVNSIGRGEGIETILDNLLPYTVNLHLKDFSIRRLAHKQGFIVEGSVAGDGMTPIHRILGRLGELSTMPNIILEQWVPPQANMTDTISLENAWAERSVAFLKKTISN